MDINTSGGVVVPGVVAGVVVEAVVDSVFVIGFSWFFFFLPLKIWVHRHHGLVIHFCSPSSVKPESFHRVVFPLLLQRDKFSKLF